MKITVFGATGGTGRDLVRQAVAAGHDVTAVVRDPARLGERSRGVEVVRADVMDPEAIAAAVAGRDAVISALGHRPGGASQVSGPGAESIIAAMRATGGRRLVVITAAGHIVDSADGFATRYLAKPVLRVLLRANFADFARTDAIVSASGLDWTIMRPSRLTNGGHKPYRTAVDHTVRGGMSISRTDLAKATLDAAADPATIGHAVAMAY
jgi:putative NADH-flavin reductase